MSVRRIGFARWRSDVPSGGNHYDDALVAALHAAGLDLHEHPVTGPWPLPSAADRRRFTELLRAEQDWLVDNIVGSAAPEALSEAVASGRRVTMLMHYFPADDRSLPEPDRRRLATSEAAAVHAATSVLVTSDWAATQISARYGRHDAVVVPPGTDRAEIASGSASTGAAPVLLWLARISSTKDPLTFVAALERVRDLDWQAYLVGPDTVEKQLTRTVRDRIAAAGLGRRVELTGARSGSALDSMWQRTDLLVHTSRAETYGMVVSEALARGIPSIVPHGTGATAAQGAGETFPPGDPATLATVLRSWLTDASLRRRWRRDAVQQRTLLPTWAAAGRTVASLLTR